jgi:hypothetical protein
LSQCSQSAFIREPGRRPSNPFSFFPHHHINSLIGDKFFALLSPTSPDRIHSNSFHFFTYISHCPLLSFCKPFSQSHQLSQFRLEHLPSTHQAAFWSLISASASDFPSPQSFTSALPALTLFSILLANCRIALRRF